MAASGIVQKYIARPFVAVNERVWNRLPRRLQTSRPVHAYGRFLHSLVEAGSSRHQLHGTFFLRNRPEMELIRRLADRRRAGDPLRVTVVASSNGAEVYSIVWTIRSARPDLKLAVHAVDISREIIEVAREGRYSFDIDKRIDAPIFERLTPDEQLALFDREGDQLRVKPWIRQGIDWHVGDAGDPALIAQLGPQDIVVANRFLCHMRPPDAERCLRRLAGLVAPGGYLFVSGVDLDVRTAVARALAWKPVPELLEEIHDGDPSVRGDWPWRYWGLEPLSRRGDWTLRYAAVFQVGEPRTGA